ncbi:MAG TPA: 50S ribosomal protein L35 [Acidobacteriota bacterium]|nr:50S ribosomal protein L35 [Acidobacteriota bacterium]
MPKLKTHKGAKKRFKVTKNKKIIYSKACRGHILTKKSAKRKRGLRKPGQIQTADRNRIKRMLPYDF